MRVNLNYPANWEDFEDLCFHLWKSIWGDHASHPNGRRGQRQNGVDIYGRPPFHDQYTGVQCKGKNGNYGQKLTREEIDTECENAKDFKPQLDTFIMATTSPRDVDVQEHCREISSQKKFNFEVDTWSWDDIEKEVQCRPDIMEEFYPEVKASELINEIKLSRITSSNKLHAFFSRPGLLDRFDEQSIILVDNVTYELATNAFEHGKATYFNVCVEGKKILFRDDGFKYNPKCLLGDGINKGGSLTLKYAEKEFSFDYWYEDDGNVFELSYLGYDDNDKEPQDRYTINLNTQDVFGRSQTKDLAYKKLSKIPDNVNNVIIDVCESSRLSASVALTFFDTSQNIIKPNQSVRVYLPSGLYYYSDLVRRYKEDPRITFILKD